LTVNSRLLILDQSGDGDIREGGRVSELVLRECDHRTAVHLKHAETGYADLEREGKDRADASLLGRRRITRPCGPDSILQIVYEYGPP
jgi:hypothetical protein